MEVGFFTKYNMKPKISAVMCTYGRFSCVERAINCFLAQSYMNKELIIYNTDTASPYNDQDCMLSPYGILFINSGKDFITKEPYTNVGAIRRDALTFAGGDYVVTWDDDDIFLPWYMEQAIDRIEQTGLPSFKPHRSFFYSGDYLRLVTNTLEASVVADINKVREYGYLLETGKEGLGWYTKMRDNKEMDEYDTHFIPSYCFNWNDGQEMKAPHKQSGDINNPENFENHKKNSLDRVDGRKISIWNEKKVYKMYQPYFEFLKKNREEFPEELLEKYQFSLIF
jgi:glycosyltransferase involved in cell wall biosynthesis